MKVVIPVLAMLVLTGCQTASGSFCAIAKPHRFDIATQEVMTGEEVFQELEYNETGRKLCGWAP